jgi:hypothetical protein
VHARDLALLSSEISTLRGHFCDRSHFYDESRRSVRDYYLARGYYLAGSYSIEEKEDVDSEGVVDIVARQGVVLATADLVRRPNGNCE